MYKFDKINSPSDFKVQNLAKDEEKTSKEHTNELK